MNPDNKSPVSGDHMSKKAASAGPIKPIVESGVSSANSVSVSPVTEKRNGKSVVCSDVPIKGRSGTGVPSAKTAQLVFFRDVKFGPQETQLRFRLIHFWEARNVLTKNLIGLEMLMIDEQRKQASRTKSSESSIVKPIQVKESANSRSSRKVSRVIDTTVIPEVTCQTEDDVEKGVVSHGENQTVDNIINKKFVAANPVKDSLHSKRLSVQRKSIMFDVQETQQTETKHIRLTLSVSSRLSLRRRSARLRPEEAEPCKSFHERGEVRETTKRRSLVSEGSRSEALEPSESGHDTSNTNGKRRVSTRMRSTKGKCQTASDTNGANKDIVTECDLLPSTVSQGDHERESKNKPRTSVGRRPSRHAAEKVQSYREVSLNVKMRRNF
ncbi:hypothetical protein Rs2_05414 [Raphanus sativus]|nr:hypothetical protein Rs2_05414 [Raphanus sativus]